MIDLCEHFENILITFEEGKALCFKLDEITSSFKRYYDIYQKNIDLAECENEHSSFKADIVKSGGRGRPKYAINEEQVSSLLSLGMTLTKIADMLGVSYQTLYRNRLKFDSCNLFMEISDESLDDNVKIIMTENPMFGERMIAGTLLAKRIKVQRWRVRISMKKLNPNPLGIKKRSIFRRTYNVPCANALWYVVNFLNLCMFSF